MTTTLKKPNHTYVLKEDEHRSPKELHPDTQRVINGIGRYHRAVETEDFVYFVNYTESDEDWQTLMYSKPIKKGDKLLLTSNNYHGTMDLWFRVLLPEKFTYISKRAKQELKLYKEANPEWKDSIEE
jgi:hypothetical protein